MKRFGIRSLGMVSALGTEVAESAEQLFSGAMPVLRSFSCADGHEVPVFRISADLSPVSDAQAAYDCRNHRMAALAYRSIATEVDLCRQRLGATRLGVVVGSSTSSLDSTERAVRRYLETGTWPANWRFQQQHVMGALSTFLADLSGAKGPVWTVSTACSSSARAMVSAMDLLTAGICDAVITGGMDTLCELTVNGFAALGQLSDERTAPLTATRKGLNIGEGGALFLLTRDPSPLFLAGGGESMDAHHMSAPHPEGAGARLAMSRALEDAGVSTGQVVYVNLHGTGTRANDLMEAKAVSALLPGVPCSSTKPFTGHCLGAAGAIEAAICCMSLTDPARRLPAHRVDGEMDPALSCLRPVEIGEVVDLSGEIFMLSNSFAFGGSNCALVLGHRGERI